MEFLRFGSSLPGEYWGCCAGDIIQNFKQDPDTKASIQLVSGDGGVPIMRNNKTLFLGPTLRDIFWQRLRIGTFGTRDMPNHFFIAVLEQSQIESTIGKKWLALLKEAGFEFIRAVDNSVYTGESLTGTVSSHKNYIFGLFRNIGAGKIGNPLTPPEAWTKLPEPLAPKEIWDKIGKPKFLTEEELVKAGAPVIMAGRRTEFPPMPKDAFDKKMEQRKTGKLTYAPSAGTQNFYGKSAKKVTKDIPVTNGIIAECII